MTQYNYYSEIPDRILEIVASRCRVLDEYIVFQSGEAEYVAMIRDMVTGDVTQLLFRRSASGVYSMIESAGVWEWNITNEFYCYSNVGLGSVLDLPVYDGVQAHFAVVFTVVLMFLVVFRSSLFPFGKRSK